METSPRPPSAPIDTVSNLVIRYNPSAADSEQAEALIADMRERYASRLGFIVLETVADREERRKQLHTQVPKNSIICNISGDGGLNETVEDMQDPDAPEHLSETPLLPIGLGNKNDVPRSAHGRHRRAPYRALESGKLTPVFPLDVTFTPKQGDQSVKKAIYSVVFGPGGKVAEGMNDPTERQTHKRRGRAARLIAETKLALRCIADSQPFPVDDRTVFDKTIVNGPRMAGNFHFPERLSRKGIFETETSRKSVIRIGMHLISRLTWTAGLLGRWRQGTYSFELGADVPAAVDGEDFIAPQGNVSITHSQKPVIFVATKHHI